MLLWGCRDGMRFVGSMRPWRPRRGAAIVAVLILVGGCAEGDGGGVVVVPGPLPTPSPAPTPAPTPSPTPTPTPNQVRVAFSFQQGLQGWQPVFADYQAELARNFDFRAGYESVPPDLIGRSGLLLSAFNQSDDVFMGAYRLVDQLRPNAAYRVDATITFASDAGTGCVGIGGSPGESVYVKAGASGVVPEPNRSGYVRLPLDKGEQATGGRDLIVVGDVATPENTGCDPARNRYVRKTLTTGTRAPTVRSDGSGRLWLVVGTDSGFEGRTSIYLLEGDFTLTLA